MQVRSRSVALASMSLGVVVITSLVLFSTCSKGGAGGSSGGGNSEDATALSGSWTSGCKADASKAGTYNKDTRTFDGSVFTTAFETFRDEACKQPEMSQTQAGGFSIGQAVEGSDAYQLDITIGTISITLHTEALVQSYNEKKVCGGGWEIGSERAVTRADCGGGEDESEDAEIVYETFEVKKGVLFFGKKDGAHDGKSDAQRPEVIDESRPFTKS